MKDTQLMAQDTKPTEKGRTTAPKTDSAPHDDDDGFHYYSGGEVKELEGTKLSPVYLWFIVLLVTAALIYFFLGGSVPGIHKYRPDGGSAAMQNGIRQQLAERDQLAGATVSSVDLSKLPLPEGQTLVKATDAGAEIYQTNCIGCHGPNQDGNGVNAAGLNPKPRNLRDAPFIQSMSLARINQSIHRGVPGTAMPPWESTLNEDQIRDVVAYVWSLSAPKAVEGSTPDAGGTKNYAGGMQNSPTPATGTATSPQTTAPPSVSGANATTGGTTTVNTAPAGGASQAPAPPGPKPPVQTGPAGPATPGATPAAKAAAPVKPGPPPGGQISPQSNGPVAPIPGGAPPPNAGGADSPKPATPSAPAGATH